MINLYFFFRFFSIFVLVFWFFHIIRRACFWLYFWEKRGSRFDRFLNGIKENFRVLFSKSSIGAFLLLIFLPLLIKINFLFESLILLLYFVFGIYSVYLFVFSIIARDFSFHFFLLPKFKRGTIFLSIVFFLLIFSFWGWNFILIKNNHFLFFVSLLIFEIIFPFLFILSIFFVNILSFPIYKFFEIKAQKKLNKNKNLIKIGICGSYGKTLTKEFLAEILKDRFKILKTEGGESSRKDIVRLINKKLKNYHQVLIFEISAYKRGEIKKLFKFLKPKILILSGVSYDHIALFGDLDNLTNAYIEASNSLQKDGVAILNINSKEGEKIYQRTNCKKYSYSTSEEKGDIFAKDINIDFEKNNLSFSMVSPFGEEGFFLNFPFRDYIENFLGGAICALELGVNIKELKDRAEKIVLSPHFLGKEKTKKGFIIIDDTSSHNNKGFLSALDYLDRIEGKKKIIIASQILELGKMSFSVHNNIGKKIGEVCDFAIFTLPLFKKEIKLGAINSGMKGEKILFLSNPRLIFKKILPYLKRGNIILLEGEIPMVVKDRLLKM